MSDLSANDIIYKNIRDLKIKFGILNCWLANMYWMPKMHKNPLKLDSLQCLVNIL